MKKFKLAPCSISAFAILLSGLSISAGAQTVSCPDQTAPSGGYSSAGSGNPNDPLGKCRLIASNVATLTGVGATGSPGDTVYGAGATTPVPFFPTAGTGSTLIGSRASSTGVGATVSGFGGIGAQMGTANGLGANAGVLGNANGAFAGTGGTTGGTANGAMAIVAADFGLAVGYNAFVSTKAQGSAAVGSNSVADTVGVVSFGNANLTRRLTNISNGVVATDAASMGQLAVVSDVANNALTQAVGANTNAYNAGVIATNAWYRASDAYSLAAAAQNDVNQLRVDVAANRQIAAQGVASALALQTSIGDVPVGKTAVSIGAGNYDGASAFGVSVTHTAAFDFGQKDNQGSAVRTPVMISAGVATGSNRATASRVGASFIF